MINTPYRLCVTLLMLSFAAPLMGCSESSSSDATVVQGGDANGTDLGSTTDSSVSDPAEPADSDEQTTIDGASEAVQNDSEAIDDAVPTPQDGQESDATPSEGDIVELDDGAIEEDSVGPEEDTESAPDSDEDAMESIEDTASGDDINLEGDTSSEEDVVSDDAQTTPDASDPGDSNEDAIDDDTQPPTDAEESEADGQTGDVVPQEDVEPQYEAPTVQIGSPIPDAIFNEGSTVVLMAQVLAGSDPLELLSWTWSSDIDGVIDTGAVTLTGGLSTTTSSLSPGLHTLTLTITTPEVVEAAMAEVMITIEKPEPVYEAPTVQIGSPTPDAVFNEGSTVVLMAQVLAGSDPLETLSWTWSSDLDGLLDEGAVTPTGGLSTTTSSLSAGLHTLTLVIHTPEVEEAAVAEVTVGVCTVMTPDDFDSDIEEAGWKLYGNAYWDTNGWLELTGNAPSKSGAIFKISERVNAGNAKLSFDIFTGGGGNGGADGFAMTVIDLPNVAALEDYIAATSKGGCLAYGVTGGCAANMIVDAFHVEIDTWHNLIPNNPTQDPTSQNHIAVTLDGNPSDHKLWAAIPTIEDQQWHTVDVDISGNYVSVKLDGSVIIEGEIDGLNFRGGYIGFSGSTGWAYNWHRIDNLVVDQECLLPTLEE